MAEPIKAWHFLPEDGKTRDFDGKRRRRKIKPGITLVWHKPKQLVMCEAGLHASENILDALGYAPGPIVCLVECSGETLKGDDKLVCRKRTVLWMADAEKTLHEFACWCAHRALTRERKRGREPDKRSWSAIRVKRRWLKGKATDEELSAAWYAAWDAALNSSAAWAAAWAARDDAWGVAWAARDDARDAERKAQAAKLAKMVRALRPKQTR